MKKENIAIQGGRENNLKNISLNIPHYHITALVGVSGSGKSSLAFDIIAREGQRIYHENFHGFDRSTKNFSKPKCDSIDGLFPVVVVEQDESVRSLRSTIGTYTELYDFLRLIYARYSKANQEETPRRSLFSFNRPEGWCPNCQGLGVEDHIDPQKIVGDPNKSLREKALRISTPNGYIMYSQVTLDELDKVCKYYGFSVDTPWKDLSEDQKNVIWYGTDQLTVLYGKHPLENRLKWAGITAKPREEGFYKGVINTMEDILRRDRNPGILRFASTVKCQQCKGTRLSAKSLEYFWRGKTIVDFHQMTIEKLFYYFSSIKQEKIVASDIVDELLLRCSTIISLGLGHLELSRQSSTLSAPETGRLRLASQVNSGLSNLVYILDEPGTGLHPSELDSFMSILHRLCQQKNSVILVSHDESLIRQCHHVVELGPLAGSEGGEIVFEGSTTEFFNQKNSFNSAASYPRVAYSNDKFVFPPHWSGLPKADIQKQSLNVVSGPSGSGKSAFLRKILSFDKEIKSFFDKIVFIDAEPIGRMPSSNIATYTGLSDVIRDHLAKSSGLNKSFFSFNVKGGRCEECNGAGVVSHGMHFMGIVHSPCESCNGMRFQPFVLEKKFKGLNVFEILNLKIDEAHSFFIEDEKMSSYLEILSRLGLGYLTLGQPSPTLSGGEAQRVKLASELLEKKKNNILYLMDEPASGLHPSDVHKLLGAFDALCKKGNTIVVADNNSSLINAAAQLLQLSGSKMETHTQIGFPDKMVEEAIIGRNIRTNNLSIDEVRLPYHQIICLSGQSGSGKSSLAIDTLYSESKRRLIENLSAFYRQMSGTSQKAKLDSLDGMVPAIALEKKSPSPNPRSIVATYAGVYEILRLAYSRFGVAEDETEELLSSAFSFNHESGACPLCKGLGFQWVCDEKMFVINDSLDIFSGAWGGNPIADFYADPNGQYLATLMALEKALGRDFHQPWIQLTEEDKSCILRGSDGLELDVTWNYQRGKVKGIHQFSTQWKGLFTIIEEEFFLKQYSKRGDQIRALLKENECPSCNGKRLNAKSLSIKINGKNISEAIALNAEELSIFINSSSLPNDWKERITKRLDAILKVGLHYITMDRKAHTLSGGEFQRLRLAGLLHTPLTGMLYVLDEPGFGLGMFEIENLKKIIQELNQQGNTILMIENNLEISSIADLHWEMGPGSGKDGGKLLLEKVYEKRKIEYNLIFSSIHPQKKERKEVFLLNKIQFRNVNLSSLSIEIQSLNVITGASGSGKTTLLRDILLPSARLNRAINCQEIISSSLIHNTIYIGQESLEGKGGKVVLDFIGIGASISKVFGKEAKKLGFLMSDKYFHLSTKEGKCSACGGLGQKIIALDFWGDEVKDCEYCQGQQFAPEVIQFHFRGKNILDFYQSDLRTLRLLLDDVNTSLTKTESLLLDYCLLLGLGHLSCNQTTNTLSGGEFQRLTMALELTKIKEHSLILLDEPSSGLAPSDVLSLLKFFDQQLKDQHTIVVASHDQLVIKAAPNVIAL